LDSENHNPRNIVNQNILYQQSKTANLAQHGSDLGFIDYDGISA
jgi:hypothetical protein